MDATRQTKTEEIPLNTTCQQNSGVPHTVVVVPSSAEPAHRDHLIWSVVNFVHFNPLCCALLPLVFSIKARDRLQRGDVQGAGSWGRRACWMNSFLTGLFIAFVIIAIVMLFTSQIDRRIIYSMPYFPNALFQYWA